MIVRNQRRKMMNRLLLESSVRLSNNMTEAKFYEELQKWIHEQGSIFEIDLQNKDQELSIQNAQHKAIFSKDGIKRYSLHIMWNTNEECQKVTVVMMNPSHANERFSDPTVTFMTKYAQKYFKAGSLKIVNISPIINPDSQALNEDYFINDTINEKAIEEAIEWADTVFLAWGDLGRYGVEAMGNKFRNLLSSNHQKLYCFAQNQMGQPKHRNQRPPYQLIHKLIRVNLNAIF
ncbi:DUF1643 domain-containing protein [Exiguobacterium sp. A1_3_1]